ncbi:MAG TPA: hypothetical protein VLA85_07275 [Verrucomicrobiae bacterium]|nr:hypothetical protein [Verrucomicrobiae bacterium]
MVSASDGCPSTDIAEGIDRIGLDRKNQDRSRQQSHRACEAEPSCEGRLHIEHLKIGVPLRLEIRPTHHLE